MVIKKQCLYLQPGRRVGFPFNLRPRPGGYPGNIMRFKIDENLEIMAAAKGEPNYSVVARELCDRFIDEGMIEMVPANFNVSVLRATGTQYVSDVCAILADYLYGDESHSIPADLFDAFCKLVIISDGCPHCGGKIYCVGVDGHELNDGTYYTPNSYIIDNYIYQCQECGKTIKSEKEL